MQRRVACLSSTVNVSSNMWSESKAPQPARDESRVVPLDLHAAVVCGNVELLPSLLEQILPQRKPQRLHVSRVPGEGESEVRQVEANLELWPRMVVLMLAVTLRLRGRGQGW